MHENSELINTTVANNINKENVYAIEDLPLRPIDIWYVFLVVLGKKTSSWLSTSSDIWRDGQTPKFVDQNRINDIKSVFDNVGIKYVFKKSITDAGILQSDTDTKRLNEICEIFIAKDEFILDSLVKAAHDYNHKEIGRLLGFPATAVEAFDSGNKIKKSELPPVVRYTEEVSFTQFMLSKDNWESELAIVKDWMNCLKLVSDITYCECRKQLRVMDDEVREILVNGYSITI